MWTNDQKYRAPFKAATTSSKTDENISKLDRTHRLLLCKFLANDDNTLSSVAQLSKPQCYDVFIFYQHFSVFCVVLNTKVEFSNVFSDNEPQRRCRAFPCCDYFGISFLPTASVYFLLRLLSLMFSTRHVTTDVAHSFILMRRNLFGMTSTFQSCHKWYITAMTNCSVTCLPSFVRPFHAYGSFLARKAPTRGMRDITQSLNGGSTAAAASFPRQSCRSLSEVIVLKSVN